MQSGRYTRKDNDVILQLQWEK